MAGKSVVETIIDSNNIQEIEEKNVKVKGRNLLNLLYNWLEEIVTITITDPGSNFVTATGGTESNTSVQVSKRPIGGFLAKK